MQIHIGFQMQGTGIIGLSALQDDPTASRGGAYVNGLLDGGGIIGHAVSPCAVVLYKIIHTLLPFRIEFPIQYSTYPIKRKPRLWANREQWVRRRLFREKIQKNNKFNIEKL